MDYQFLLFNLCELFVVDDYGVDDDDLAKLVLELGVPSISNVHLVKDRGNSLFREGNFVLAARHYTQALKLVCFLGFPPAHDQPIATSLCLSLVLNLAVCELKLSQYNRVCYYCSFVLSFDPTNVKALYRRGLAFKNLNRLNEALDDFKRAVKFEPHNNDVNRELHYVADLLMFTGKKKQVSFPFNPLGSDKKGKQPLLPDDLVGKFDIPVDLDEADEASCSRVPLVTDDVSPTYAAISTSSAITTDSVSPKATGCDLFMDSENLISVTGSDIVLDSESRNVTYPALPAKDEWNPSNNFTSRPRKYSFSNKKHPKNDLHLSSQDYENLLLGRNILFFHPRSLSSLRVRPLTSTNFISTGTPHEDFSREAAVPIPDPSHEERHHHTHLGSEHDDKLGQDEAVLHIVKKKRLSSDSSLVSKISMVQFEFVAVKESSSTKGCRKVEHSIRRDRMVRSGAISRKRSAVSVDILPFFCRYKDDTNAVKRSKRKEADFLQFEDYYHPPFKKCRLSVSVSFACNFSSVSSICSSLGVSNSPMFVL